MTDTKKLKYFGIINEAGLTILSVKIDKSINEQHVGGLFSAFHSFCTESFKTEKSQISLEDKDAKVVSLPYESDAANLIAIGLIDKDLSEEHFRTFAGTIMEDLCQKYEDDLTEWDGDLMAFNSFEKHVETEVKETFNKENEFESKIDKIFDKIVDGDLSGLNKL
ncbi:MAG: hypothetical protein ACOC44_16365 [Promethearchaeia archaeon]